MRAFSEIKRANYFVDRSDKFNRADATFHFEGLADSAAKFVEKRQLLDTDLWKRFVTQFRIKSDSGNFGWRGEYFGKMMRGACFVFGYTKNSELYNVLRGAIVDVLDCADDNGAISTYGKENELCGWDIWCRKYVMLGMQYFLEICDDEKLADMIVNSLSSQADYLISKIGPISDGKKPITKATSNWRGLNSSSVLEPIVRLYNITQDEKYLAFADYIVSEGGTSVANIFRLAYENKLSPYQYPITKAYEMTSCFEGLLEYYRVKRIPWHKEALVNYATRLLETDFTIIGSSGCTHELFDHSTVRQASSDNEKIMQETCVTVTLMKFSEQMTLLTGDSKYADAFEISFYNAYLGALNTEDSIDSAISATYPQAVIEPLCFDSYSSLTLGKRGNGVGGLLLMPDLRYYGCCACIGSAGVGLVSRMAVMMSPNGVVINFYEKGKIDLTLPSGKELSLLIDTDYPRDGRISVCVASTTDEPFSLIFRNPSWSESTKVKVCGKSIDAQKGYIKIERDWSVGDTVELELDMSIRTERPVSYDHDILMNKVVWQEDYIVPTYVQEDPSARSRIAFHRGPLVLAASEKLGYDVDRPFDFDLPVQNAKCVDIPEPHTIAVEIPLKIGRSVTLVDYASAGKTWQNDDRIAAWIDTK